MSDVLILVGILSGFMCALAAAEWLIELWYRR